MLRLLGLQVKALRQHEPWHVEPARSAFLQRNAEIFEEVIDKEPWLEITLENPRRKIGQGPTSSGTSGD